jgi:hypothetical protein
MFETIVTRESAMKQTMLVAVMAATMSPVLRTRTDQEMIDHPPHRARSRVEACARASA